jgi:Leucine-rich repeat (LRR) protein
VELETGMYKLTHLDLSGNQLTEDIPYEMWGLAALTHLDLSGNQITGEIPTGNEDVQAPEPGIDNLQYLNHLDLSDNQLTGDVPPEIGNLNYLTRLYLNDNQYTGVPEVYNQVSGQIEGTICNTNISWSDSLFFNISNNKLCPPYPPCIEDYLRVQDTTNCD